MKGQLQAKAYRIFFICLVVQMNMSSIITMAEMQSIRLLII